MWRNNARGLMICVALFMMYPCGSGPSAQTSEASQPALNLYYTGNRQSAIEPCGCRTKEQGGVELEAYLYKKNADEADVRLDAGEWSTPYVDASPLNSFKSRYLLRALALMKYDAVNVGISDLELGSAWFTDMAKKHPESTGLLISANIFASGQTGQPAFPTHRILTRQLAGGATLKIGVTGVTSTRSHIATRKEEPVEPDDPRGSLKTVIGDYEAVSAEACLDEVVAALRPEVDMMILLNAGDLASSEALASQFPEFDFIITAGGPRDPGLPLAEREGVQILNAIDTQGKIVAIARLTPGKDGRWTPEDQPEKLLVSLDLPPGQETGALIEDFKNRTEKNISMPTAGTERIYAGAQRCMSCHHDQHRQWRATPHARALDSLVAEGEQFNTDCLPCHVAGFRQSNGFYSVTLSPSLLMRDVQCENCHGSAAEHANTQERLRSGAKGSMSAEEFVTFEKQVNQLIPPKSVPESVCITCHDTANDPDFNYQHALPLVTH